MLIKDMFNQSRPLLSFEIFPPRRDYPVDTIYSTVDALEDLKPDFISVTYGAGGSTTKKTVEIASAIKQRYGIETLAHLTCISSSRTQVEGILGELKDRGVSNILALRGDLPKGGDGNSCLPGEYGYAKDLILHIRQTGDFCIGAACYPEGHIEAGSLDEDLLYLKDKVECGVHFLITQLFFDNDILYRFIEKARNLGIDVPVLAGIIPVIDKGQVERIVSLCGCSIPRKFARIMYRYEHSPGALREAGIAYATEQIVDLLSSGVEGIHIYTMNRPKPTRKIIENISTIRNVLTCKASG